MVLLLSETNMTSKKSKTMQNIDGDSGSSRQTFQCMFQAYTHRFSTAELKKVDRMKTISKRNIHSIEVALQECVRRSFNLILSSCQFKNNIDDRMIARFFFIKCKI